MSNECPLCKAGIPLKKERGTLRVKILNDDGTETPAWLKLPKSVILKIENLIKEEAGRCYDKNSD